MEQNPTSRAADRAELFWETLNDTWFVTALGTTIITLSCGLNILTESNISEPRAGIITGSFAVAAVASGKKALSNFLERCSPQSG